MSKMHEPGQQSVKSIPKTNLRRIGIKSALGEDKAAFVTVNGEPAYVILDIEHYRFLHKLEIRESKRYKLDDLLAQCDISAPATEELKEWDAAPAVGNEIF